jgi:hypothetical protein
MLLRLFRKFTDSIASGSKQCSDKNYQDASPARHTPARIRQDSILLTIARRAPIGGRFNLDRAPVVPCGQPGHQAFPHRSLQFSALLQLTVAL